MFLVWKVYFFLLLVISIFGNGVVASKTPRAADYADVVFSLVAVVGIFGFAFQMAIGGAAFWRVFFLFDLAWLVVYNVVLSLWLGRAQPGVPKTPLAYAVGLAVFLPSFWGLYSYAFRSNHLWRQ